MANGDIIEYGAIEAITSSGTHDFYSASTVSHDPYETIRLYPGLVDPQISWVEYNYNNKKTYIAKSMCIHYINYSESVNVCNNSNSTYTYIIDGSNYVLTFMPIEFWTGLPSSVYTNITTANITTDDQIITSTVENGATRQVSRLSTSVPFE